MHDLSPHGRLALVVAFLTCSLGAAHCGGDDSWTVSPSSGGDGGPLGTVDSAGTKVVGLTCDGGPYSLPPGRSGSPSCSSSRAASIEPDSGARDAGSSHDTCASDADCSAGTNGRCVVLDEGRGGQGCSYDMCFADSDCAAGSVCSCGTRDATVSGANVCVPSSCTSDAQCGAGFTCAASGDPQCPNFDEIHGYYCHSIADSCLADCDCAAKGGPAAASSACRYQPAAATWSCVSAVCVN